MKYRKSDRSPRVALPADEVYGGGTLKQDGLELSVPTFRLTRQQDDLNAPWEFRGYSINEEQGAQLMQRAFGPAVGKVTFDGVSETGQYLQIDDLEWVTIQSNRVEARAHQVDVDAQAWSCVPEKQYATVQFSPNTVTPSEYQTLIPSSTGEVNRAGDPIAPWQIETAIGVGRLVQMYDYKYPGEPDEESLLSTARPTLFVKVPEGQCQKDPREIFATLERDADDLSRLMSLLSRRRVGWTCIDVVSHGTINGRPQYQHAKRLRRAIISERPDSLYPMVVSGRMAAMDLGNVLTRFRVCPYRQAILTAIVFLVGTFSDGWLEQHIVDAFTALESLTSGIHESRGTQYTLDDDAFDALSKALKPAIKTFATGCALGPEARNALYRKLPELRRPSIVQAMLDAARVCGVDQQDTFVGKFVAESYLSRAYDRRSILAHSGNLPDPESSVSDYVRVHAICERMIFKTLGCDDRWLIPSSYQHLG